jgi:hypothetical protein
MRLLISTAFRTEPRGEIMSEDKLIAVIRRHVEYTLADMSCSQLTESCTRGSCQMWTTMTTTGDLTLKQPHAG